MLARRRSHAPPSLAASVLRAAAFVLVTGAFGCGEPLATLSFETIGSTKEAPVAVPAGTRVFLTTYAATYSYSGPNSVMLDAALLKGGAVVAEVTCTGLETGKGSGAGCGACGFTPECSIKVPDGGADAIRVATRLRKPTEATFEGFEVRVR